jgi:isocitrate/isopropylmalate dehydrogenase
VAKNGYNIALMPGDGIGPEVTEAAVIVMSDAAARHSLTLNYTTHEAGAAYYRKTMEAISAAHHGGNRSSRCRTARR